MRTVRLVLTSCVAASLVLAACGDDAGSDAGMDAGRLDAGPRPDGAVVDAPIVIPDGARRCVEDEDCADGVVCTRDICDDRGVCRNPVDLAVCDDGVFCNGVEQCDPLRGCVPGPPETCNDDDVCTLDMCDEEEKICRRSERDFDMDGEADWHCEGGTDCDDTDPRRGSEIAEICADLTDNDCDGDIDEEDCGRPDHDTCDDALDVSAGGSFVIATDGASADYSLTCGGGGRRDLVATFTIDEAKDVRVSVDGSSVTWVALREDCEDRATEFECASGFPGQVRARSLSPGTYFILFADIGGGEVDMEVDIDEPTPPPTNETCETPVTIGPEGATIEGNFIDVMDDVTTACGTGSAPDLVYTFSLDEPKNVVVSLVSTSGDTMSFAIRSVCADAGTELRCARGAPAGSTVFALPAGDYFLIIEGPSFREVEWSLDVSFEDPTPPPPADTCELAVPVTLGTPTLGTLADKQDDLALSCSFYNDDAVYSFELAERSDVTVEVDASGTFMYMSVRTECDDGATQLRCVSGAPARARLRDLGPGTYYVVVESFRGSSFNLTVERSDPTTAVAVSGNENCETAYVMPATGGLFTGDTTTMLNDYEAGCGSMARSNDAVFQLDLSATKRVVASTEGTTFDSVLHLHRGVCASMGELACDDDGGDGASSLIERELTAGTYFFVVDGWGTASVGAYTFEALVSDP